ncbi:MAG TPA: alpha/beta hydrolase [Ornithinimicrobium sp.]|uniref:alpha/beta fold hydrolase n=1 Tax=Ornithinimicrobium sp. TaxID=1977084 RepID=UPI002B49F708|nr:alpha/beta hydrolase [Ornithinimicrobium sp.]HKJ11218.1 alpha/beta hydrolase [Ornithinimicrobium sp.]
MSTQRTHYVTTTDGVTIGGTVHGHGPPLVFLQGSIGDGDLDWHPVVEHMADRFTCHLPSMRGRGLSSEHPDLSFGRIVDDFLTYVHSLGEPAGLVGWSAPFALGAAGKSDAVEAVAVFEPGMISQADEREQAMIGGVIGRTAELASEGKLEDAARAFAVFPFTDDEIARMEGIGYLEAAAPYVPNLLAHFQSLKERGDPLADPAFFRAVSPPVLVLLGSDTKRLFTAGAQAVTDRVPDARLREVPGAGHAGPLTHPEVLAEAFTEFFSSVRQPA